MELEFIRKAIEIIRKLMTILGDITLSETVTWLTVKENALRLRQEGREEPAPIPEPEA